MNNVTKQIRATKVPPKGRESYPGAAEVLARLLNHERLRGLEAVDAASTTRLAAFIWYLESQYAWTIGRVEFATGTKDGRVVFIAEYFLDPAVIEKAMAGGASRWRASVLKARAALRAKAARAYTTAKRLNDAAAKAKRYVDPRQRSMFDYDDGCAA